MAPVKVFEGFEAYVVMDKTAYKPGYASRVNILIRKLGSRDRVSVRVRDSLGQVLLNREVGVEDPYVDVDVEYSIPERPGVYEVYLELDGKLVDSAKYVVEYSEKRKPLLLATVWHHHQAPNYLPDGLVHGPWAYVYVWGDYLKPYGKGPYHYHAVELRNHPDFKTTYNLSPSLLVQWEMALEKGVVFEDGRRVERGSREVDVVRETLDLYREALFRNQIDVLTSIYAHTIAGFLVDVLGMDDVVRDEIAYGIEVTKRVIGGGYEPRGFWTPEMAFTMKLVPILHDNGLEYTVLDDINHYSGAEGEKKTPHQPYILVDRASGKKIVVFFRDHALSDILSFKNNFNSEIHAWKCAYEFSYMLLSKWFDPEAKTLTLALDGENWMVFSKTPPLTAFFMDKLILYLETLDDSKFLKLTTLREVADTDPPRRILYNIPTNTWLGSFRKWRGEVGEHEEYWVKAVQAYRKIRAYERLVGGRDNYSNKARWALWHALDSDYWWAEFWLPRVISEWLTVVDKLLDPLLSGVKVVEVKPVGDLVEGVESKISIKIANTLDKPVYITVRVIGPIEDRSLDGELIRIEPRSEISREVRIIPRVLGRASITVYLISSNYVIAEYPVKVDVKPHLQPNPV